MHRMVRFATREGDCRWGRYLKEDGVAGIVYKNLLLLGGRGARDGCKVAVGGS